ncbi:hypothetical protein PF606_00040, partial [Limosilactobacillus fermentum]
LTESFVVIGGRICRSTIRMDHFWSGSTSLSGLVKDFDCGFSGSPLVRLTMLLAVVHIDLRWRVGSVKYFV